MEAMATTAKVVKKISSKEVNNPMKIGIEKKPTQSKASPNFVSFFAIRPCTCISCRERKPSRKMKLSRLTEIDSQIAIFADGHLCT